MQESYASRFREVWNLGIRKGNRSNGEKQVLTELQMYEYAVSEPSTYERILEVMKKLKDEHIRRDSI